ncbi:TSPAN17 [Branchiostoma lanceolatum]|uniref:Tetraspanin n=1 Tax=Branchiostoma lanceolatum TaxID=7740 RepID=A0A8K0EQ69_BRALA|nr:TSPAN17 [Branchiostoma lanceolatum]
MAKDQMIRTVLIVLNVIFWLIGALFLCAGLTFRFEYYRMIRGYPISEEMYIPVFCLMALGAYLMIITFCGCCGAASSHKCMLTTFAVVNGLMLLVQIVVGILMLVYAGQIWIGDIFERQLRQRTSLERFDESYKSFLIFWQEHLTCCGLNSKDDWKDPLGSESRATCLCILEEPERDRECLPHGENRNQIYVYKPCVDEFSAFVGKYMFVIGGILMVICILQVLAIIGACTLVRRWRDEEGYVM